jgi:hypothetical protein
MAEHPNNLARNLAELEERLRSAQLQAIELTFVRPLTLL